MNAMDAKCPKCGYSLAGLDESGACPECGWAYDSASIRQELALRRTRRCFGVGAPAVTCVAALGLLLSAVDRSTLGQPTTWLWLFGAAGWWTLPVLISNGVGSTLSRPLGRMADWSARLSGVAAWWAFGAWSYYQAFVVHLDPQSGLVFIFAPLWGMGAVLIASAGAGILVGLLAMMLRKPSR